MARLAWLTDLHLNFVGPAEIDRLCLAVKAAAPAAVALGGDISDGPRLAGHLARLDDGLGGVPIYFVLGNHDFYHASFAETRARVERLCASRPHLVFLESGDVVVPLSAETALVGHGGWADGRFGKLPGVARQLNDYRLIEDLVGLRGDDLARTLARLGDEAAARIEPALERALADRPHAVVLTHVPPYRDACWHEGRISNEDWLPHFSCKAVGDAISRVAARRPDRRVTVLCGHTHSPGVARVAANVLVKTGAARYGKPVVQDVLDV